jgi:hypothetical protein
MRLKALYLTGALMSVAIPLSAGAAPSQRDSQTTPNAEQMLASDACGRGWYWRQPGMPRTANFVRHIVRAVGSPV